jgi:hypothetical protein
MTRLGSLVFCATLGLGTALFSCGGGSDNGAGGSGGGGGGGAGGGGDPLATIPASGEVSGWEVDPALPTANGPLTATTMKGAVDLVDGGADSWYSEAFAPDMFIWQNYKNGTVNPADPYTLKLYVLQLPSAAQATTLYDTMVGGGHSLYTATNQWEDTSPAIGDMGRITNSGTDWWINFRKGVYYCEVRLTYAEKTDLVGKQQTIDFATAVAAKM